MQLDKAIKDRRSIRKFKSKTPSWKKIIDAINAATYAPMAGDIFSLNFVMVNDPRKIQSIAQWSEQEFIAEAKYVVLFCTKPSRTSNSYAKRGKIYCKQQAGAAIQNFLLTLTQEKLSTCWVGHFNENKIKSLLKIPEDINIEAIFPIGVANEKPKERKEKELNNFLNFNEWGNRRMRAIEKVESRMPEGYGRKIAKDL